MIPSWPFRHHPSKTINNCHVPQSEIWLTVHLRVNRRTIQKAPLQNQTLIVDTSWKTFCLDECVCEVRLHVRAGVPRSCSSCQEHKSESFVPEGCKCNRAHLLEHLTQSEEADDKQICVMCNMRAGHGLMWEDGGSVVRPVGPVTGTLFLCADSDKKECCTKINRGYGSGVTQTRLCLCVSVCQEAVAIKQALELFLSDLSVKGIWNYKIQPLGGGIVCATLIMFGICQQQVHYVSAPTCLATSLWRHVRYYMFRAISFCIVKPVGVFSRSYVVFCAYWFGSNTACNSAWFKMHRSQTD